MRFVFCPSLILPLLLPALANAAELGNATVPDPEANLTSRVHVHIPFEVHRAHGYQHVQAKFGFTGSLKDGGQMAMEVHHINEPLCQFPPFNVTRDWKPPFMVASPSTGQCTAVRKARHAQQLGASALIILDDHCLCSDQDCMAHETDDQCHPWAPQLTNDGSGNDISIPTFLIYKDLKDKLTEYGWSKKQPVLMELIWGLKPPTTDLTNDKIELSNGFWTSAYDPFVDMETYHNLRALVDAFGDKIDFHPRYSIVDGTKFKCNTAQAEGTNATGPCDDLCTNHGTFNTNYNVLGSIHVCRANSCFLAHLSNFFAGRYCTVHGKGVTGKAVIEETLRRLCIWNHTHTSDKGKAWWEYTLYHKEQCAQEDISGADPHSKFSDPECIKNAMAHAGINPGPIDECMVGSETNGLENDVANTFLQEELDKQVHAGIVSLPAVTVNHRVLELSTWQLFENICTEYWRSNVQKVPDVCIKCGSCSNVPGCLRQGGKCVDFDNSQREPELPKGDTGDKGDAATGRSFGSKVLRGLGWMILFAAVGFAGYFVYMKRQETMGGGRGNGPLLGNYLQLNQD